MTPREPRRKVMIKARMRVGGAWSDVCILNISRRGLAMQTAAPPPRGTYVEIRRGAHQIAARVMWASQRRFGVRTQDDLAIDAIIDCPDRSDDASPGLGGVDRRLAPRCTSQRHHDSRMLSRAVEFTMLGLFAASAGVATFATISDALAPLAEVSAALAPKSRG